jgi:hypothetical protein
VALTMMRSTGKLPYRVCLFLARPTFHPHLEVRRVESDAVSPPPYPPNLPPSFAQNHAYLQQAHFLLFPFAVSPHNHSTRTTKSHTLTCDDPGRRIGTEHEKFGYQLDNLKPIEYEAHVKLLLEALVERFNWEPMMEGGLIIGAKLDGQSVTLEPGGQFELSGAPLENLHLTCAEVHSHLYQVRSLGFRV